MHIRLVSVLISISLLCWLTLPASAQSSSGNHWNFLVEPCDIGGFGIGADLTWQIQAYLGYQFSPLFQMTAGYRIIGIGYEKGQGEDRFKYDINTSGPVIRFGFNL